jgi:hypothetical protein
MLLLENRPELAARLERVLFDRGFEVLHLTGGEALRASLADGLRLASVAGIVVIYSGDALPPEAKQGIASEFGTQFFEAPGNPCSDEEIGRQVLAFAQLLRPAAPKTNREKVN